jgi:hypothetical protein
MDNEKPNTEPLFEDGVNIVVIRHFFAESQARLYAAQLKDAGIPSFISNANIMAALPLGGGGGIQLHIKASDAVAAQRVISRLDFQARKEQEEQSFHDATKEDILYLQAVHKEQSSNSKQRLWFWLILIVVILLILRAYLRAAGIVESWWDFF